MRKTKNFHYLQVIPVKQPNKPDHLIRIVYAANQKQKLSKKSLNDHLLSGPNDVQDLVKLVLKFRSYFYVFNLDCSRMFNRYRLIESDQDFLRLFKIMKNETVCTSREICAFEIE